MSTKMFATLSFVDERHVLTMI
jgi:hypothetical protein